MCNSKELIYASFRRITRYALWILFRTISHTKQIFLNYVPLIGNIIVLRLSLDTQLQDLGLYGKGVLCHQFLCKVHSINQIIVLKMFDEIMCKITAPNNHYNDVIMNVMASQITSLTIVYSIVYSGADQRRHQSFASLAFLRGIHRWPVNSPHKRPVTRKMFPFDDVIMIAECQTIPIAFQVLVTMGLWGAAGTDEMDRPSQ